MAHNHGNEYQINIVHEDGTEELSEWMNSQEQVAQAMAAVHRPRGKDYWLRERNLLCPNCPVVRNYSIQAVTAKPSRGRDV